MPNNNHSYTIGLDIKSSQASKRALKELQIAFANGNNSVRELNKSYVQMASSIKDTTELDKQYAKVINDRIKDREKEIDKLKAMQIGIVNNKKLTEEQRKNLMDNTKKRIEMTEKEIETLNRSNIVRIKQLSEEARLKAQEAKLDAEKLKKLKEEEARRKKLSTYIKADLTALKEKIKEQFRFISALKTTEGRYNAIKKVISKSAQLTAKAGFKGLKVAGGVAGAMLGGAVASAGGIAEKEKALSSLKTGIDPALVDDVYVKTGADFPSIVQALNTMSDVTRDAGRLIQGAVLELQNPGAGKMLLSGTQRSSKDIQTLTNAIAQIKKQTGTQDISSAIEAASRSRLVTSGDVSQLEYIQAYSALAQKGLDEEKINRILRHASKMEGNFIDNLNKMDLSKFVYGQDKTRLSNVDLGLSKIDINQEQEKSSAQSVVEKLRQFELKKDELMMKFMEPAVTVMEALEPVINIAVDVIKKLAPAVKWLAGLATDFYSTFVKPIIDAFVRWWNDEDDTKPNNASVSGGGHAQGGVITSPSIVGEAGPELVLPLDNSRAGRTSQIINNFTTTQSFNLASSQNTPLALASAVGQNRFVQRTKVF